jgi:UDP-N-acetylmuramate dehydrogenase
VKLSDDVPLAPRTTLGVGGAARQHVVATTDDAIVEAVRFAKAHRVDLYVLGGGSNVVVSDAGVEGLVLSIATRGITQEPNGSSVLVTAAAGEPWDSFVGKTVAQNLAGLECLSGVPGLVGATPIQNVGAYGQEVSETIVSVRAFDRDREEHVTLSHADCRFAYRDSFFKSEAPNRYVVTAVTFRLIRDGAPSVKYPDLERRLADRSDEKPGLADVRRTVLDVRREKSMLVDPHDANSRSCGSFFVNPIVEATAAEAVRERAGDPSMPTWRQPDGRVKLSAAWLIEHAGFSRGTRDGAVGLSTKHTLCLVAHGGARATDVVAFARRIRRGVDQRFGVRLVPEPVFWGFASLDDRLPDERLS